MAKLTVSMRRLVLIHKVHIDLTVRDFAVELRMQMADRTVQYS